MTLDGQSAPGAVDASVHLGHERACQLLAGPAADRGELRHYNKVFLADKLGVKEYAAWVTKYVDAILGAK